jgi:hypothetical protein
MSKILWAAALACMAGVTPSSGQEVAVISEWMYAGSSPGGGEFIEITNVSPQPIDLAGWSIDDSNRMPGSFTLTAAGVLKPGQSVVITQDDAADFRKHWSLASDALVIGGLGVVQGNNLGRNDEINVYDASGALVDRLTYGDQAIPGSIRTQRVSGIPRTRSALGANDVLQWQLSVSGDDAGAWTSSFGDLGSPCTLRLPDSSGVVLSLNEVMALNTATVMDEDGDRPGWIELHNGGMSGVNVQGFGLSRDPDDPYQWKFPDMVVPANGQLMVFASGKDRADGVLHTNFSVDHLGDRLFLTDRDGHLLDSVALPELAADVSYGRQPDGSGAWGLFLDATPGQPNATVTHQPAGPVTFSTGSGMYETDLDLVLSGNPGTSIHYTLDGSLPTTSSPQYTGPIRVTGRKGEPNGWSMVQVTPNENWAGGPSQATLKATVVRAVAVRAGGIPGPVRSSTYLVGPGIATRYTLPVVSVIADPQDLFGYERGIYALGQVYDKYFNPAQTWWHRPANYTQRGDDWERPGHLTLFESAHDVPIDQRVGYRIHGGVTRSYQRKSLRIYARGAYGTSTLDHRVFPDSPLYEFKRLILRNSGQDWNQLLFKDALLQGLIAHRDIDTQASRHAIVLVNGEYWGIHDIRERLDKHYVASHHGVDPDALDMLETGFAVDEGSNEDYMAVHNMVMGQDPADPSVFAQIRAQMDVENHALYGAFQVIIGNHDWPQNNIAKWRPQDRSMRWRWLLYDTDVGYTQGNVSSDSLGRLLEHTSPDGRMFSRLLRSAEYRELFISLLADLMNFDLAPSRVNEHVDRMDALLRGSMIEHIQRWPVTWGLNSIGAWNSYIAELRAVASGRSAHVRAHVVHNLSLPGTCEVTVPAQPHARGRVMVNTLPVPMSSSWSGTYFQGVPVTLRAEPSADYRFDGLEEVEGSPEGNMIRVALNGPTQTLTPRFRFHADLNGDDAVDGVDLCMLLSQWGSCASECQADLNGDGVVGGEDITAMVARWGPVP